MSVLSKATCEPRAPKAIPTDAEPIARGAAQRLADGLGIATVYRNIKALVEEGWLVVVELPGQPPRYELAGKGHHHHFHCNSCGQVFELHGCVESFRSMIPHGFQITGHDVLLYGVCQSCRTGQTTRN